LGLAFFGLTQTSASQHRVNFLTQIHEICFYGQGGYSWPVVYNMPIWLRKFTYNKVKTHYEQRAESIKNAGKNPNTKEVIGTDGKVKVPNFSGKSNYS
jgi:hypothetical protein